MSKILVMGFTKLKYMPYINLYLDNIAPEANDIHILYWNRDRQTENLDRYSQYTLHEFDEYQEDQVPAITKVGSFLKYRRFALRLISKYDFDRIIVLHTLPAVLIADRLRHYAGRFILDYRDSTYETFRPFKYIIGKIVKWSAVTFVSSDAFRRYLPKSEEHKTITSHNILLDSLHHQEDKQLYGTKSDKIRVAFWGFIRHKDINLKIINRLANDSRFELHYYGREQQTALELKQYAQRLQADNIFFHGEYKPEERYEFIKTTDIIHNIYLDTNTLLAMGNKFYDGIIFRIPQVCMTGSFMGQMCEENNVGVCLNPEEEDFADRLESYWRGVDVGKFNAACMNLLERIVEEYQRGSATIQSVLK